MINTCGFDYEIKELYHDEGGFSRLRPVRTDSYLFRSYPGNNIITISVNGTKRNYKVKEDSKFTYSIQKTQIKAVNGADGLIKFFMDESWRHSIPSIIHNIINNTKEVLQYVCNCHSETVHP